MFVLFLVQQKMYNEKNKIFEVKKVLKLIVSRAGYGKTTYIQKSIKELVNENKKAILIIPEQISFESERDILKAVGPSNLQSVGVMSFTRLCSLFFAQFGGREKPYIDAVGKTALMEQTLKKLMPSLKLFKKSALTPQFCDLMIELDSNCKKNSVYAENLLTLSEKNEGILKQKLFETSLILSEYQKELNKDYFDPLDDLSYVTDRVGDTDFFEGKTVFIDSFTGFTAQQLELIKKIIKLSKNTFISFDFDGVYSQNDFSLFSNISKIALSLKKYAAQNGVEVGEDIVFCENLRSQVAELDFLEKNIFSGENNEFDEKPENIFITKTKNIYDEAEYVAKKILELVKNSDLRFREISVISRDANEYNKIVDEVFEKYNIPLFVDCRQTVENFSLFKLVSYSLLAVINNFDFDSVMSLLKTGILGVSDEDASLFEMYCIVWRINGKEFLEEFNLPVETFLNADDKEYCETAKKRIENVRKKLITPLQTFKKEKGKSAKSICFAIFNLIKNYECGLNLKQKAEFLEEKGYIRLSENTARSYDILIHVLDQLYLSLSTSEIDLKRFFEIFSSITKNLDIGSLPQGLDAVAVGSAERMRPKEPKVTFIIGANEGVFPSAKSGSGLFTDDELKTLKNDGINLPFYDLDTAVDEQYLAYLALCSPSEKLFVSYVAFSLEGEQSAQSVIVDDILKLFPKIEEKVFDNSEIVNINDALKLYAKSKGGAKEVEKYFENHFDSRFERVKKSVERKDEHLSADIAKSLYGKRIYASASKIETFNKCHFSYFCKYGLKLSPVKTAQIDNLRRGSIVHYVLEKMVEKYSTEDFSKLTKTQVKSEVTFYFEDYLKNVISNKKQNSTESYKTAKLKEMIINVVYYVFKELKQSDFENVATELEIGNEEKGIKPLKVDFGDGELILNGVIDRVDIAEKSDKKYLRIIDYKTGKEQLDLSYVLQGRKLQMPLYMKAAIENGKQKFGECLPAGMFYFPARDETVSTNGYLSEEKAELELQKKYKLNGVLLDDPVSCDALEPEREGIFSPVKYTKNGISKNTPLYTKGQFDILSKYIDYILKKNANEILSGDISINPVDVSSNDKACKYCDYYDICKFKGEPLQAEQLQSTQVFEKMQEIVEKGGEQ